jgi:hypothetical protein
LAGCSGRAKWFWLRQSIRGWNAYSSKRQACSFRLTKSGRMVIGGQAGVNRRIGLKKPGQLRLRRGELLAAERAAVYRKSWFTAPRSRCTQADSAFGERRPRTEFREVAAAQELPRVRRLAAEKHGRPPALERHLGSNGAAQTTAGRAGEFRPTQQPFEEPVYAACVVHAANVAVSFPKGQ